MLRVLPVVLDRPGALEVVLEDRLDVQGDVDLVAHDHAAARQPVLPSDAEVVAVDRGGGRKADPVQRSAVLLAGPDLGGIDLTLERGVQRAVPVELDGAVDVFEEPAHPGDHHVPRAELGLGVAGLEDPSGYGATSWSRSTVNVRCAAEATSHSGAHPCQQ